MKMLRFEGATMREAIAKVKAELGDQAVIVSTRQVRRGMLGSAIEVSAAIDDADDEVARAPALAPLAPPQATPPSVEKLIEPLKSELRSLRAMLRASSEHRGANALRSELASLRKLVEELRVPPRVPADAGAQGEQRAPLGLTTTSTARIVLLAGPTGAGKTTTIAKLAARAALVEDKRVRLVTLDNYRVGGVEQIRTFADLIGVPLTVVEPPDDLRAAIDHDDDLVLIDTAGRSPRDAGAIDELAAMLSSLPPVEVHLVLPASSSAATIDKLVAHYRGLAPARLLFTKVDEVETAEELVRAPARTRLPVTWVTTGQAVPEDLEAPTDARLHELAASGLGNSQRSGRAVA